MPQEVGEDWVPKGQQPWGDLTEAHCVNLALGWWRWCLGRLSQAQTPWVLVAGSCQCV